MQAEEAGQAAEQAAPARALAPDVQSFLDGVRKPGPAGVHPLPAESLRPFPDRTEPWRTSQQRPDRGTAADADAVQLNPNDPTLTLQLQPSAPDAATAALQRANCLTAPVAEQVTPGDATQAIVDGDPIAKEFAKFNVSNDAQYRKQRRGRAAGLGSGAAMMHSPLAAKLELLPLPSKITKEMCLRPHHPVTSLGVDEPPYAAAVGLYDLHI